MQDGDLSPEQTHFWDNGFWEPLWLSPAQILDAVTTSYSRKAGHAHYLADGLLNQSWKIDDDYVLRVSRPERTLAQVQYEHDVIRALHRHIDVVVPPITSGEGGTVAEYHGYRLSLFPFVTGIPGTAIDPTIRTRESARVLAEIHRQSLEIGQRPDMHMIDEGRRWPWPQQKAILQKGFADHAEARQLIALFDAEYQKMGRWLEGLKDRPLPRGVVHGDFNPRNLIFAGDEIAAVIDWDNCRRDILAFEVGITPFVDQDEFFAAYLAAGGPLEPADADLLAGFQRIGALSEVQWAVNGDGLGRTALSVLRDVARDLQLTS
ncbi:MAG TPA: phosphotransferase [Mycobacteriales bacterium]|nr:phosphotransferase [Mycobacteriales bacterium]